MSCGIRRHEITDSGIKLSYDMSNVKEITLKILPLIVMMLFVPLLAIAGTDDANQGHSSALVVGVKHAPPFAIKQEGGQWSGISVELWRDLAEGMKLEYRFQERDLPSLLAGVEKGELDAAVGALTVTAERARRMDFSHPFYTSGLSIAVPADPSSAWLSVVKGFFTWQFLNVVTALFLLLLVIGILVWLFEHKHNRQFGGPPINGIGSGLWWSAVTMTTVGYGDKSPVTMGGRLVALVWMFASIIIISGFTAAIASSLTVGQLATGITGPQDLYNTRTGTVMGSSSEAYLQDRHIGYVRFDSIEEGLTALVKGEVDAFVYDKPLLRYLAKTQFQGDIDVLANTFSRQDYAIALPQQSRLKEGVDQHLLQQLESPDWQKMLTRYLGLEAGSS